MEIFVREEPRPRSLLPVDEDQIIPAEVLKLCNSFGIPFPDQESLLPVDQVHQHDLFFRKEALNKGDVIFPALFIEEVCPCKMGLSPLDREEPAHAPHMG